MDVTEIDAASNRGIDEVRELREKVRFAPSSGKVRVFIIDEVHMLTNEAFNALLKTLEDPPEHVMFILATTEPHRVPLTILSRCQRFDFHRIGDREMTGRLKAVAGGTGIFVDDEALELIVRAAEGGMRDALSILDQAAAYSGNKVGVDEIHGILGTVREDLLRDLAAGLMSGRCGEVLQLIGDIADQGRDLRIFLKEFNAYLRKAMLDLAVPPGHGGDQIDRLSYVIEKLAGTEQEMRWSTQPRVLLEVAMVRAARVLSGKSGGPGEERLGELAARLSEVEGLVAELAAKVNSGSHQPANADRLHNAGPDTAPPPEKTGQTQYEYSRPEKAEKRETAPAHHVKESAKVNDGMKPPGSGGAEEESRPPMPADLLLKKIDSRWNDILEMARRIYPNIATHLTQGKSWPLAVQGKTLTIAFPKSEAYASLAVGILENEANRKELSKLIKSVCKEELSVHLVESDRKPPRRTRPQKKAVNPEDVEALFGKGEEMPADGFEGFE
jgi:DNA polymerase-3 subunit gamma/tau